MFSSDENVTTVVDLIILLCPRNKWIIIIWLRGGPREAIAKFGVRTFDQISQITGHFVTYILPKLFLSYRRIEHGISAGRGIPIPLGGFVSHFQPNTRCRVPTCKRLPHNTI